MLAVGTQHEVARDVRIVAATNRDLEAAMAAGSFRPDLYARLAATTLTLPSLSQRREDILLLAQKFAPGFAPSPRLVAALLSLCLSAQHLRELWPRRHPGRRSGRRPRCLSLLPVATQVATQAGTASPVAGPVSSVRAVPEVASAPSSAPRWRHGDPFPVRPRSSRSCRAHHGNLTHIEQASGYSRRQFRRWVESYVASPRRLSPLSCVLVAAQ